MRWPAGDYAWRNYSIKKRCWFDSELQRGGSTLELAALALELPADTKIEGESFFRCWRYAAEHWDVPPPPEPKPDQSDGKEKKKKSGTTKPWSPIVARYVYRQADGTPYLQVCRTAAKTFFQNKWNGQMWVAGKPDGPKLPYRLPGTHCGPAHGAGAHHRGREGCGRAGEARVRRDDQQRGRSQLDRRSQRAFPRSHRLHPRGQ